MEYLESWINALKDEGKSSNTIRAYKQRVDLFAEWFELTNGNALSPQEVTPSDLRDYKVYLQNVKKRKAQTVNLSLNAILSLLNFHEVTLKSPSFVKLAKSAPQALDKNQQHALMRAVERSGNLKEIALITMFLHVGLRVSEMAALDIEDISLGQRSGQVLVRQGKGNKERVVPLNNDARKALKDYIGNLTSGPVFLSQRGRGTARLTISGISQIISKYAYLAKLPGLHPHTLRHTFAKNLIDAGVDVTRVAELLGHDSLVTTQIYTKPTLADLAQAVDRISLDPNI